MTISRKYVAAASKLQKAWPEGLVLVLFKMQALYPRCGQVEVWVEAKPERALLKHSSLAALGLHFTHIKPWGPLAEPATAAGD